MNCISLRRYNLYVRRGDNESTELSLIQTSVIQRRAVIRDVDPYVNFTVGVSLINNAFLESDIVKVKYVGSKSPFMICHGNKCTNKCTIGDVCGVSLGTSPRLPSDVTVRPVETLYRINEDEL